MMLSSTNFRLSPVESLCTMISGVFDASSPAILAAYLRGRGRTSTTTKVYVEGCFLEEVVRLSDGLDEKKLIVQADASEHESLWNEPPGPSITLDNMAIASVLEARKFPTFVSYP